MTYRKPGLVFCVYTGAPGAQEERNRASASSSPRRRPAFIRRDGAKRLALDTIHTFIRHNWKSLPADGDAAMIPDRANWM